jgi:hypothetical protein
LRIQGFESKEKLISLLEREGAVAGPMNIQQTPRDLAKKRSFKQVVNDNTITAAGWGFIAGDALLALAGIKRGDWAEAGTGILWGSTGVALAFFGKKDPEVQRSLIYRKLEDHLQQEGIPIPRNEHELMTALKRPDGIMSSLKDFMYNNAADFHHVVQSVGGMLLFKAGLDQQYYDVNGNAQKNWWKASSGVFVSAGQLLGMMPEKEPEQLAVLPRALSAPAAAEIEDVKEKAEDYPQHDTGKSPAELLPGPPDTRSWGKKTVDTFMERPLLFSGLFPFINNVLNVIGAVFWERHKVEAVDRGFAENATTPEARQAGHKEYVSGLSRQIADKETQLSGFAPSEPEYKEAAASAQSLRAQRNVAENVKHSTISVAGKEFHPWQINSATAACYMFANLMYAMSSKNNSVDLKTLGGLDGVYDVAANTIASQPKSFQHAMTERLAAFLSEQPDIKQTADQVAHDLETRVASLANNPWLERIEKKENSQELAQPLSI